MPTWSPIASFPHRTPGTSGLRTLVVSVDQDVAETDPIATARLLSTGFRRRVGTPDAHVLATHLPSVIEIALAGLPDDWADDLDDGAVRVDLRSDTDALLWRGNLRIEPTDPTPFGRSTAPRQVVAYDGVERLASVPYTLSGPTTIAETITSMLAPLGHGLPVVVLLDWRHDGQHTTAAPARALRVEARRWGALAGAGGDGTDEDLPTTRDALEVLLRTFGLQLVQTTVPASADPDEVGGAVWLAVARSLRGDDLRAGTSPAVAAWTAPSSVVSDVPSAGLALPTATVAGVQIGASVPLVRRATARVISRHPLAQEDIRDPDIDLWTTFYQPRWWSPLRDGAASQTQRVYYADATGDIGAWLIAADTGFANQLLQTTERCYPPTSSLRIRLVRRIQSISTPDPETALAIARIRAVADDGSAVYLVAGAGVRDLPTWSDTPQDFEPTVETPYASTVGTVEVLAQTPGLPFAARIEITHRVIPYSVTHSAETTSVILHGSVTLDRGATTLVGTQAIVTAASTARADGQLVDVVPVHDLSETAMGSAVIEYLEPGLAWAPAEGAWGVAGPSVYALRARDIAAQLVGRLDGVDLRLRASGPAGVATLDAAGWLVRNGRTLLPSCIERDEVSGAVRVVAWPLLAEAVTPDVHIYSGTGARVGGASVFSNPGGSPPIPAEEM